MCFSAPASFVAAAVLGGVGVATLAQKPERKRLAFAFIPLVFAAHQMIEGFIWLSLPDGAPPGALVIAYLIIAQIVWPTYTPLSVLLMEDDQRRRWALGILLLAGLFVSASLGAILVQHDYGVSIVNHRLQYATDHQFEDRLLGLYLVATTAPLLISRHRYVMAFGGAVLLGSMATQFAYHYAAASVWCYFAAIGSAFVFLHIRRRARLLS
ncbi:MAG: DUF6629 family protein [Hyphococcus sp.]